MRAAIEEIGATINLVPSRRPESFGLSAIEGMACSCLTITSGVDGLADVGRETGAWTATSAGEWRNSLDRIQGSSADELREIARIQQERTSQRYAPARFARELLEIVS